MFSRRAALAPVTASRLLDWARSHAPFVVLSMVMVQSLHGQTRKGRRSGQWRARSARCAGRRGDCSLTLRPGRIVARDAEMSAFLSLLHEVKRFLKPWRSRWWRRRESNPRPKAFCNDVYMHIRVVVGNPRPEAPFPLSVPHRINPANRGSEPIPCAHRRLGKTASKAHLSRRPFPPGRRGQEERGYLSSQCQFSVGFCFVSTVYERWTPDMQSLLHMPSSNPVRPPSSRD